VTDGLDYELSGREEYEPRKSKFLSFMRDRQMSLRLVSWNIGHQIAAWHELAVEAR